MSVSTVSWPLSSRRCVKFFDSQTQSGKLFCAGANFLHISMATLTSKWFGEGEKIVKAAFAIAHRIAPCVIFVDEVDSMLGKRGMCRE